MTDKERKKHWELEYTSLQGISMEYTGKIPEIITTSKHYIEKLPTIKLNVLDVGCGKGRIGLHLARAGFQVTGLDFSLSAIETFSEKAKQLHCEKNISLLQQDITAPWMIQDLSFDLLFAVTVINNLVKKEQQDHVVHEINRVVKPGALVFLETYTEHDGYYGPLLHASPNKKQQLLKDPYNNLIFRLYREHEIIDLFHKTFTLVEKKVYTFESLKYKKKYPRESVIMVFKKE